MTLLLGSYEATPSTPFCSQLQAFSYRNLAVFRFELFGVGGHAQIFIWRQSESPTDCDNQVSGAFQYP
jgi:hypothetical protein